MQRYGLKLGNPATYRGLNVANSPFRSKSYSVTVSCAGTFVLYNMPEGASVRRK